MFTHQRDLETSHIHRTLVASIGGRFGEDGPNVWISPLQSFFWFFDLDGVADSHMFLEHLASTDSMGQIAMYIRGLRKGLRIRERSEIPI